MSVMAKIQTALQSVMVQLPESVVTVAYNGKTTTAMRRTQDERAALMEYGEQGLGTMIVNVRVGTIDYPERGKSILIGAEQKVVMDVKIDTVGALYSITTQKLHPVTPEPVTP
jgi:hypothetical protein